MLKFPIYLDYNSTTPVDPRVLAYMIPYFREHYGNAASKTHLFGQMAEKAVDKSRKQVSHALGCSPQEVVFTSGATEANNLAIKGVVESYAHKGDHIITLSTVHKSILDVCKKLEQAGKRLTYLGVDHHGLINLSELQAVMTDQTILLCMMLANNETGTLQPIREIAAIAQQHGVILMSDAAQAVGKQAVKVDELGIDLLTLSAHKFYGPKGVGALYIRRHRPPIQLVAQIDGGGHERGLRGGTLNVPAIVGLGKALEICQEEMSSETERLGYLRDKFERALLQMPEVYRNGHPTQRLSGVSNLAFGFVDNERLIMNLQNLALAMGSACTSDSLQASHVLKAMGLKEEMAHASIRFSFGRFTSEEEIDYAISDISQAVKKIRKAIK